MQHQLSVPARAPAVVTWYKVYCGLMAFLYLLVAALGVVYIVFAEEIADNDPGTEPGVILVIGIFIVALGVVLLLPFAAAPFLPRQPWVWIYHLVLICLGMTSVCCLPVTIPLLIFWIKPEAKTWYGRSP